MVIHRGERKLLGRTSGTKQNVPACAGTFWNIAIQNAERTGLEPATSYVTGRRSNQLNYHSFSNQN